MWFTLHISIIQLNRDTLLLETIKYYSNRWGIIKSVTRNEINKKHCHGADMN